MEQPKKLGNRYSIDWLARVETALATLEQYPIQQNTHNHNWLTKLKAHFLQHGCLNRNQKDVLISIEATVQNKEENKASFLAKIAKIKQFQQDYNRIPQRLFVYIVRCENDLNTLGELQSKNPYYFEMLLDTTLSILKLD